MLRYLGLLVIVTAALVPKALWWAPLAFAAGEAAMQPSTLDQIKEGLLGTVLLVITIIAAFVAKALPGVLEAGRLWLIEWATSERVKRVDDAIDTALAAGQTPDIAAATVAKKLPKTLERSGKKLDDIAGEAAIRQRAQKKCRPKLRAPASPDVARSP